MSLLTKNAAKKLLLTRAETVGLDMRALVGNRGGNVYTALVSAPPQQSMTAKVAQVVSDDVLALRFYYGNWYFTSDGVYHDGPNQITVKVSVLASDGVSMVQGVSATGLRSITLDPGCWSYLDVPIAEAAGATVYEIPYVTAPAGGFWPIGLTVNFALNGDPALAGITGNYQATGAVFLGSTGEGDNLASGGADLTAPGSAQVAAKFVQTYSSFAMEGFVKTRRKSLAQIGDSIDTDNNDYSGAGYMFRAAPTISRIRLSHGGDRASNFVNATKRGWKTRFLGEATHALTGHGRNDLSAGDSVATWAANTIAIWKLLDRLGVLNSARTILPNTTSSNDWINTAGQTVASWEANRVTANTWLRDGAPLVNGAYVAAGTTGANVARCRVYDKTGALVSAESGPAHPVKIGVLEVADVLESARNSGKWDASTVRTLTDITIDVSTTNSKYIVNSPAQGAFTAADQVKLWVIPGAGTAGATLKAKGLQVVTATQVKTGAQAQTAVTGATGYIGVPTSDGVHPSPHGHQRIADSGCLAPLLASLAA